MPVLDVGGTHVSAALVDIAAVALVGPAARLPLDANGPADAIVAGLVRAASTVAAPAGAVWGVAMPDPFDYERGIARFAGVGKFDALNGLNLGAALASALPRRPQAVQFLNDADAFTLGEYTHGAAAGFGRVVGITLGTGVGSGWVVDGRIVADGPGVPPGGRVHRLTAGGLPLEDRMSRRAIRAAYAEAGGDGADVREIAARARQGESRARAVLDAALQALGGTLGPAIADFGAEVVVVGGSMAASWDLFEAPLRAGFAGTFPPILLAGDPEHAPLFGAARFVSAPR